jgi:hypothetical protein
MNWIVPRPNVFDSNSEGIRNGIIAKKSPCISSGSAVVRTTTQGCNIPGVDYRIVEDRLLHDPKEIRREDVATCQCVLNNIK